jgi:hypothetical protein
LIAIAVTSVLLLLRPLPVIGQGVLRFAFHHRATFFRAALTPRTGGPCADFEMRERSGRQDVPKRSGPNGLARRASEVNATT